MDSKYLDAFATLMQDRVKRIELLLKIVDKQKNTVPLIPMRIQRDILTAETGRDVYVKPGQIGASSIIIADYLMDTITIPGTVSVIVSHEEFITQRLLNKAQAYYDSLLERVPSIPKMHHKSSYEKTFPDIHSSFYIGSARAYVFGRGETIHNLLCDEYAFWDNDAITRIMAPIMKRVPITGRIKVISTPNGEDNAFCEMYRAAKEGYDIGRSVFKPHFYSWFMHEEYSLPYDSPFVLPGDGEPQLSNLTADELRLMELHDLTHDQIRWRRHSIAEMESLFRSGETRILFQQEFPEDDETCFLSTGDMAYDSTVLDQKIRDCIPPTRVTDGISFWHEPEKGKRYLVSMDVGIAKASATVITAWEFWTDGDKEYGRHCATIGGLIMPDRATEIAVGLSKYYNGALFTWDAASQGLAVAVAVKDKYNNVYYRTDIESGKSRMVMGWLTTSKTKLYMYDQLRKMLPNLDVRDSNIISQLRNMRFDGTKLFAVGMDDYHDSAAIAVVCRSNIPTTRGFVGVSGWSKW